MDALKNPEFPPRFRQTGKTPSVEISQVEYMQLLVNSHVTDPQRWPPGKQDGARLLARIRQIEQDCIAQHGQWDWELLTRELQDEYDGACIDLDELIEPFDAKGTTIQEFMRKHRIPVEDV